MSITVILEGIALILAFRGTVVMAKFIVPPALIIAITYIALNDLGLHNLAVTGYFAVTVISALLLGAKARYTMTPLAILAAIIIGIADMTGFNKTPLAAYTGIEDLLIVASLLLVTSEILQLLIHRLNENVKRAQENEQAQIAANRELKELQSSLEQRIVERTAELEKANEQISKRAAQLQTITELSEAISQIRDLSEVFSTTVNLISERFGFYHVGIFLIDSEREYAILQAANSEGGKRMLQRNHRLKLGTGLVGYVAQTGQPRIALNVGADAVFFDNPDLPETRSEAALPLKSRGEVIGVLDVQSTETGAFSTEDLRVLTTLANQVSIALENIRLLTETRAALTQVEEVYNEFTRAEWGKVISKFGQAGFRYQMGRIEMLEKPLEDAEVQSAAETGEIVTRQTNDANGKRATMAVPVKLRGEVIGVLHIEANDPSKEWQEDEISLVRAVAERAAFAMENARLFQDARRRAAKERLISESTSRISSALNLENILYATAEELERVLGGSEVLIQFHSKEQA
ncbi:MAG TPA: GAF domain-containing protein [Anaerolineales bacterium]|nr:GAF domain-containing protein [Anaerolineales bacterium]